MYWTQIVHLGKGAMYLARLLHRQLRRKALDTILSKIILSELSVTANA